jgi:hypothetical protein
MDYRGFEIGHVRGLVGEVFGGGGMVSVREV